MHACLYLAFCGINYLKSNSAIVHIMALPSVPWVKASKWGWKWRATKDWLTLTQDGYGYGYLHMSDFWLTDLQWRPHWRKHHFWQGYSRSYSRLKWYFFDQWIPSDDEDVLWKVIRCKMPLSLFQEKVRVRGVIKYGRAVGFVKQNRTD